jgi:hypothetical protein
MLAPPSWEGSTSKSRSEPTAQDLSLQRGLSKGIVVGVRGGGGVAEAAQSQAQMATQVQRDPVLLAPGLEGTDFRGVRGLGVERPVPQNKRCLEDAVPGKPKKIGFRGIAEAQML